MSTNTGSTPATGDVAVQASGLSALPRLNGNEVVKWTLDKKDDFMSWWKTTPYGTAHHTKKGKGNPKWDSRYHQDGVWKFFDQGARLTTGDPVLCCRSCPNIYVHPNKHHSGTSSLACHIKKCSNEVRALLRGHNADSNNKDCSYIL